jgi:hypothetical protein
VLARRLAFGLVATLLGVSSFIAALPRPAHSGGVHIGGQGNDRDRDHDEDSDLQNDPRVQIGFDIAPVHLNVGGHNHARVGLGSYLVNAVGGCNDCHTCPSYQPGNSPYQNGHGKVNDVNYLAGGVQFGPFTSRNITPDFSGKPAGITADQFVEALRTGHDTEPPHDLLQVMPWPVYRNMSDRDLRSIYEYLSTIPHAMPGVCSGAGQ